MQLDWLMSLGHKLLGRRLLLSPAHLPFNALVARSVGKLEVRRTPEAQAALQKEWDKLVDQKVWDASSIRAWKNAVA